MRSSLQNKRFYKVKNAKNKFICPLCVSPREMRYSKNLSINNFLQVAVLSIATIYFAFSYSALGPRSILCVFVYWAAFELINKFLYRRELPCPHCGFDATWYRRDVKMARQKVQEFWENQELVKASETKIPLTEKTQTRPVVNPLEVN